MSLTCRVQYLNDVDPFAYASSYPEPPRPPVHTFSATLPLINQLAAVHRLLRAPHRVSTLFFIRILLLSYSVHSLSSFSRCCFFSYSSLCTCFLPSRVSSFLLRLRVCFFAVSTSKSGDSRRMSLPQPWILAAAAARVAFSNCDGKLARARGCMEKFSQSSSHSRTCVNVCVNRAW
ncbi:hypothetical protein TSAR_004294 [Trichomalopsis sarcophagae]|uniref:FHOD1 N-terminal GTPase-binding domain-containing protein n=1 Tax=Trichomalopsis sarcophagae TaxID=543379 RepID=A0A232EEX0_9HYME|nr:hypothetical protein TSAR_004294 [Trichomalopsis sarcophagae]